MVDGLWLVIGGWWCEVGVELDGLLDAEEH